MIGHNNDHIAIGILLRLVVYCGRSWLSIIGASASLWQPLHTVISEADEFSVHNW
jgi:hypothetical protein